MKKLFVLLMVISFALSAQVIVDSVDINKLDDVQYCQIVGTQKFLSWKVRIDVDYGQNRSRTEEVDDFWVRGEDGKKVNFHSMIHALNFMYKNGWEYVDAFVITKGKSNVYHYILRRRNQ